MMTQSDVNEKIEVEYDENEVPGEEVSRDELKDKYSDYIVETENGKYGIRTELSDHIKLNGEFMNENGRGLQTKRIDGTEEVLFVSEGFDDPEYIDKNIDQAYFPNGDDDEIKFEELYSNEKTNEEREKETDQEVGY